MTRDLRRMVWALAVCAAATAVELVGAVFTHSLAVTADGLHSMVHVGALLIAIWGARRAAARGAEQAGEAAIVNVLIIIGLSVLLAVESVSRLTHPEAVAYGPALAVTAFGLLANVLTVAALGHGRSGDLNHRAALVHMLGDGAVAILALAGLSSGALFGWSWADPACGLVGAGVLGGLGGRVMLQTLGVLDPAPSRRG